MDVKAKVEELRYLRREIDKLSKREKALAEEIRVVIQCGFHAPGAKLSEVKKTPKWAAGALQTAQEISPLLLQTTLVDIKSVDPELLDECKRHGIVEYRTAHPRVILEKPSLLDS